MNTIRHMSIERIRRREHVSTVERVRDWLIEWFKTHPIFESDDHQVSHVSKLIQDGIQVTLRLQPDTYADAYFVWDGEKESIVSSVSLIGSGMGQSTGFFLFHLQLLLAVLSGATEITLDNDTDDPIRARQGIYRLFESNLRGMDRKELSRWAKKPMENQLRKPEMVLFVTQSTIGQIKRALLERVRGQQGKGIWRSDAADTLSLLFRAMRKQFDLYSGGTRRKTERKTKRARGAKRTVRAKRKHHA